MNFIRALIVWVIALCLVSALFGGATSFFTVFLIYGIFMTLPALAMLAIASRLEGLLIRQGRLTAAFTLGPVIGLLVPIVLIIIAPNKSNAIAAIGQLTLTTVGTGLLWAGSLAWSSRRSQL